MHLNLSSSSLTSPLPPALPPDLTMGLNYNELAGSLPAHSAVLQPAGLSGGVVDLSFSRLTGEECSRFVSSA